MDIEVSFITGLMLGVEYVEAGAASDYNHIVIDILFARFLITF
jgi:hypothetical protein